MSVYVDECVYPFGRMMMCHMVADSLGELHAMAWALGLKQKWFQNTRHPHYDICKSKRALAVKLGAIEVDRRQLSALIKSRTCSVCIHYSSDRMRCDYDPAEACHPDWTCSGFEREVKP